MASENVVQWIIQSMNEDGYDKIAYEEFGHIARSNDFIIYILSSFQFLRNECSAYSLENLWNYSSFSIARFALFLVFIVDSTRSVEFSYTYSMLEVDFLFSLQFTRNASILISIGQIVIVN